MNYTRHNAAKHAANPYADNYGGFTWNNLHSSSFNCFIENTGHLEFVGAPDFSNNFVSPAFQTRTYYTGMQTGSKKFTLNLVFNELTLRDLNSAFRWLDRNIISDFYFDYEPYWKYSCKLSSIGAIEKYVVGHCNEPDHNGNPRLRDLYLCKVPVTFETVYRTEALSTYAVYWYSNALTPFEPEERPFIVYYDEGIEYLGSYYHSILPQTVEVPNNSEPLLKIDGQLHSLRQGENTIQADYEGNSLDLVCELSDNILNILADVDAHYVDDNVNAGQLDLVLIYIPNNQNIDTFPTEYQQNINDTQNYFDLNSQFQFVELKNDPSINKYYDIIIKNPSAYSTNFKLHLYNVVDGVTVYQVFNNEAMEGNFDPKTNPNDIDPYYNITQICHVDLGLEEDFPLDLHYNSEDGTVMCCNRLIEQLRGADSNIPCIYKSAMANITIPGAADVKQPAQTMLRIVPFAASLENFAFAIEYDIYEYMV